MGIKIKHTNPTLNEFSTKDLVVNVQSGSLFFKSNTKLFKLQGDDQSTTDTSDSLKITGLISSIGPSYVVELDGNNGSGPRINMGTSPTSGDNSDYFMSFGAYDNINNLDTKNRDFHLYGTNTTTGFYFDESAGNFGIGTSSPQHDLHIKSRGTDNADGAIIKLSTPANHRLGGYIQTNWYAGDYQYIHLGSSYYDGSNWITNEAAQWGSNHRVQLVLKSAGFYFVGSASTANTAISEDTATFLGHTKMFIADTGEVGIGTTSPKTTLHIDGGTDVTLVDGSGFLLIGDQDGLNIVMDDNEMQARNNAAASELILQNEGGEFRVDSQRLVVKDGGNVGIGIDDPETKLSVLTNFSIVNSDFKTAATAAGSRLQMGLGAASGDTYSWIQAQDLGATSNNNLYLQRYGGNVGIGGTTADQMLHIYNGSVLVEPITYANSQNDYVIKYGAYNANNWDSHGLKFKSTSGGSPYTSWRTYTTDDILTWNAGGTIAIGTAYWGDGGETLYVQRPAEAATTGFTCVAAFKNPTNASANQGVTAGIKLKLGS